jgi:murein DD-endopeptidase MepM/ murein hydrolase activator NlpD
MNFPVYTDFGRFRKFGKKYEEGIHLGYDFDVKQGSTVRAVSQGVVVFADMVNGFGSLHPSTLGGVVIIKHGFGFGLYGHLDNIIVKKGDIVDSKYLIGFVNGFESNGVKLPHLHLEYIQVMKCH